LATPYILLGVAAVFLTLAVLSHLRNGFPLQSRARTWLIVSGIFIAVATWLLIRAP